jgi:hypothetical protein
MISGTWHVIVSNGAGASGYSGVTGGNGSSGYSGLSGYSGNPYVPVRATFTNASLTAGVLTITHNLALSAPYSIWVVIFDNTYKQVYPDEITGATNTVAIDLTSFGTLTGTWGYAYVG